MSSPVESKMDENEVTSHPHHHHHHGHGHGHGYEEEEEEEVELGFPLVRQPSLYSLTLDEIQNTMCEPGKTFGSMNMDEFLNNIWNVEEAAAAAGSSAKAAAAAAAAPPVAGGGAAPAGLSRQGSLALPSPLCRKTVDEVWAEIHRGGEEEEETSRLRGAHRRGGPIGGRQPTMGEMTLEDFLVKAGVVREGYGPRNSAHASAAAVVDSPPPHLAAAAGVPVQPNYGFVSYPPHHQMMNGGGGGVSGNADAQGFRHVVGPTGMEYQYQHQQDQNAVVVEGYCGGPAVNGKSYHHHHQVIAMGSPTSPLSSDGVEGGHLDNGGGGAGPAAENNGGTRNGRKRIADAGVEKVVERRQRRMIKNRESAARSRARKQAYTVELEAELNMLKEENACLRAEERRVKAMRTQAILECMAEYSCNNVAKTSRSLRRTNSAPW